MQASGERCCQPSPARIPACAPRTRPLPDCFKRLEAGRRPPSGPFLRALWRDHPKDNSSCILAPPPSRDSYLPTSTAPPTGSQAGASLMGQGGGTQGGTPFPAACSNGFWPLSGDAGRPCYQLGLPTGTPPQTTAAPWRTRYCTAHLQMLHYLTQNVWMHFHVGSLQQHKVRAPNSPQRRKEGDLICRSQVQKRKPHHPIKRINAS